MRRSSWNPFGKTSGNSRNNASSTTNTNNITELPNKNELQEQYRLTAEKDEKLKEPLDRLSDGKLPAAKPEVGKPEVEKPKNFANDLVRGTALTVGAQTLAPHVIGLGSNLLGSSQNPIDTGLFSTSSANPSANEAGILSEKSSAHEAEDSSDEDALFKNFLEGPNPFRPDPYQGGKVSAGTPEAVEVNDIPNIPSGNTQISPELAEAIRNHKQMTANFDSLSDTISAKNNLQGAQSTNFFKQQMSELDHEINALKNRNVASDAPSFNALGLPNNNQNYGAVNYSVPGGALAPTFNPRFTAGAA